ncbi:MAG: enoyl-CoA hydratase/isomerase family protein [Chloroflexi bacterium]|nr:enoyl-CoA hydratase/isomerase family protein [Chloroflexota bacterium]
MEFEQILYEKADGVATITLNRPERMNAFTPIMIREWALALEDARTDADVRAVIVTGAGRGFCAGADLRGDTGTGVAETARSAGPVSAADRRNWLRDGVHNVPRQAALLDKPYIAAVNGAAVGAGMDMCSMTDIRIASEQARFAMSYVKVGLVPGDGGCYYLPRIVGLAKALELIWTGDFFDAEEALRIGYVTKVVPPDELLDAARDLAGRIAQGPAVAIQLAKRLAYRGLTSDIGEALEAANQAMAIVQSTEDAREGPRAFAEKRPPQFQGR